jgi:hypothetical protein
VLADFTNGSRAPEKTSIMRKILLTSIGLAALLGQLPCHAEATAEPQPHSLLESLSWDRVQGRVAFTPQHSSLRTEDLDSRAFYGATKLSSVTLIGSYYLSPSLSQLSFSGLRATSGLMLGQRSPLWGINGSPSASFGTGRRALGSPFDGPVDPANGSNNTPYVGIGYTGFGGKGNNWGFSADLGLISLSPGSIVRLGRVFGGSQNLDDMVRDLRLAPVLQLGISYSF